MQRYCNGILRHTTGEERLATNWDVCKMECLPAPQTGGQVYSIYGKFNKAGANYSIRPNQLNIHEHSHARTHSTCILGRTELVDAVWGGGSSDNQYEFLGFIQLRATLRFGFYVLMVPLSTTLPSVMQPIHVWSIVYGIC